MLTKGHHSFYLDIYLDGKRDYGHILTELTKPQRQILKALDIPFLEESAA
ncbi:hypothetical protein [Pelodictyon luteolum]|nr:hypothetical protein [Pelodictyon luteolum]